MASPPFNISEAVPGDSDIVSQFPAAERTYRDIVEDWINTEHDTYGHHKIQQDTTTNRDADVNWSNGSLFWNTTLNCFQVRVADAWKNVGFESGTRITFQQTSAPTGYTKESDAAYNDATVISTTGSVATAGTVAASTLFARTGTDAVTLSQSNLPNVNLSHSLGAASHTHSGVVTGQSGTDNIADTGSGTTTISGLTTGSTAASGSLAVSGSISLGGSGSSFTPAIDMRVKRYSVIVATKD